MMVKQKVTDEKIISMHEKGMTDKEMAKNMDMSYARMLIRRKRLDLKPNTRSSIKSINIPKETIAYFAGVIDGEGTITIRKSYTRKRGKKYLQWQERIYFKMINKEIPKTFTEIFHGSFYKERRKDGHDLWVADLTNRNAATCILTLRPYLKIKRRQCNLALKLRESKDSPEAKMRGGPSGKSLRKEVLQEREKLYREIKALNQKKGNTELISCT